MRCPICQNEDEKYFYEKNGQIYCRKCIEFSKKQPPLKVVKKTKDIYYRLDYPLTPNQKKASYLLIERYKNQQDTIMKGVCGAGKTEIIYGVIEYALNLGQRVCLTMPRKELVVELSKRIEKQFFHISPVLVYGDHHEQIDGQFIICTTHQLYRYPKCFDLLILDEFDAFPYRGNEVLESMLKRSIKGHYIMMSATLEKGDVNVIERFHHQPIPVPQCVVTGKMMMYLLVLIRLKKYQKEKKPVFLFVPNIQLTKKITSFLDWFGLACKDVSSKTSNIHQQIEKLKKHEYDVLVCTTVLERGMTVANVQVLILYGELLLFDKETLIQIAGRAGRKPPYIQGDVLIYAAKKTLAMKACIENIKTDNALSATKS